MKILLTLICVAMVGMVMAAAEDAAKEIHGEGGITLPAPPATVVRPVTETIGGTTVTDDYRWLEDAKSPETRAWVGEQEKYTQEYLAQVKVRPQMVKRLTELERVDSYSIPVERAGVYFFKKRLAAENQGSIYVRRGLHGADERLVDATKFADQNTSVTILDVAKDGSVLVYGERSGGADEESVHLIDVKTGQELKDALPRARYAHVGLTPDKTGLYYAKFTPAGSLVYLHAMGGGGEDQLIFGKSFGGDQFGPMELISATVTENGRWLLITVAHGVPAKRVDVYVKDLRVADAPVKAVIHGIDSRFTPVNYEDDLYVLTDQGAENYRVVKIAIKDPAEQKWATIVPEGKDALTGISIVGGKLFVTGLHDVVTETRVFTLGGKETGRIAYPTLGAASQLVGREEGKEGFYNFQSFNVPPTIYRYEVSTGEQEVFAKPEVPFDSNAYEVKQVFYASKDGTKVPMFISGRKGLKRDGSAPALMAAYGGFLVSETPVWNPMYAWWMEQGGFYAQPNLRGGGEYGEKWHKAGMFAHKQNVFDDFFAAAEYLTANRYTTAKRLAISGRSNGGLLMGAAMTQQPELFGAIWCGYPLLDMIRFQHFLVGRWWTAEYGSAEDPEQFKYLIKYSPYQNVHAGEKYPAIMFNTGDSDTRVDPLHARKMTALMQAETGSERPILLHYQMQAGHSAGVSVEQQVSDEADELSFLWNETGGR